MLWGEVEKAGVVWRCCCAGGSDMMIVCSSVNDVANGKMLREERTAGRCLCCGGGGLLGWLTSREEKGPICFAEKRCFLYVDWIVYRRQAPACGPDSQINSLAVGRDARLEMRNCGCGGQVNDPFREVQQRASGVVM